MLTWCCDLHIKTLSMTFISSGAMIQLLTSYAASRWRKFYPLLDDLSPRQLWRALGKKFYDLTSWWKCDCSILCSLCMIGNPQRISVISCTTDLCGRQTLYPLQPLFFSGLIYTKSQCFISSSYGQYRPAILRDFLIGQLYLQTSLFCSMNFFQIF